MNPLRTLLLSYCLLPVLAHAQQPAKPVIRPAAPLLTAPVKVAYVAIPRNTAFSGQVTHEGATWTCVKGQCRTSAFWRIPSVAACAGLAAKAGVLTRFGSVSAQLPPADLAECNRSAAATATASSGATVSPQARAQITPALGAQMTRNRQAFANLRNKLRVPVTPAIPRTDREKLAAGWTKSGQGRDCDDSRSDVNPNTAEVCDHRDNNCDGAIDEGVQVRLFLDADGDTHGDAAQSLMACPSDQGAAEGGRWLVTHGNDCDDTNPDRWHDCP